MSSKDAIAIVGIGCRFPGADNPDAFWDLLREGRDAIREVPANRFDLAKYYGSAKPSPGKVASKWGGYLNDIERFDAGFFGIAPREAVKLDPQQRLLLEVAWEALEDGGLVADDLRSTQVGVFVGLWAHDFEGRVFERSSDIDLYTTTGSGRYAASGRISYALDLRGPSVTLDAACASSHVAVHLAVQSLRSNECSVALAGAANMILQPHISIAYSQSGMLAPDGRCKFGDARANGYVRSEGSAVVVLKRLEDALADGDPIRAVILGSAVNHAGQSSGLLVRPSQAGQEALLRNALKDAEVEPWEIQYVEAHGTGTSAGDPVEIGALGTVLGERGNSPALRIGSVKSNIGHSEAAAGLAGLIKASLALERRELPQSLHFEEPTPKVPWVDLAVEVQSDHGPWPEPARPLLAGVSSYGITGTSAHIVLREPPRNLDESQSSSDSGVFVLPLSAHTPQALQDLLSEYQKGVLVDEGRQTAPLPDVCYTAAIRRTHHEHRAALVGASRGVLAHELESYLKHGSAARVVTGKAPVGRVPRSVFIFPGQGSQWLGMGRQLMDTFPVFAEAIQRCDDALRPYVDWILTEELLADNDRSRLDEIDVVQPVLFAIQVALSALWRSWGVEPDAVVGHSMGEVAAAHVAGAISLDDAARVITTRSRLMRRTSGQGAMAVVELGFDDAHAEIAGFESSLSVAVSNSPRSSVIAGDPAALDEILSRIEAKGLFCRRVKVDVASHSPQMEPLVGELITAVQGLESHEESIPIYSTVTGGLQEGARFDANYWGRNLRQPVRFGEALTQLIKEGHHSFIELSPHPVLLQAVADVAREVSEEAVQSTAGVPSFRREEDEIEAMMLSLATLYTRGHRVDWRAFHPGKRRVVPLPTYPWQRERFWFEDDRPAGRNMLSGQNERGHPLLGARFGSALHVGTHFWEFEIDASRLTYVADHVVKSVPILPGAAMAEFAASAAAELLETNSIVLEDVQLEEALPLQPDHVRIVQIVLSSTTPGRFSFQMFSREGGTDDDERGWIRHTSGTARAVSEKGQREKAAVVGGGEVDEDAYERLRGRGLDYGPQFQVIRTVSAGSPSLTEVRLPEAVVDESGYLVHPILVDAAFQSMVASVDPAIGGTLVPVAFQRIAIHPVAGLDVHDAFFVRVLNMRSRGDGQVEADLSLADAEGNVVIEVKALRLQQLASDLFPTARALHYDVQWVESALDSGTPSGRAELTLLGDIGDSLVDDIAKALKDSGANCRTQYFPASGAAGWSKIRSSLGQETSEVQADRHIVCVLPAPNGSAADDEAYENAFRVVSLVQSIIGEVVPSPRLFVVTRGSQNVSEGDASRPEHAAAWGLVRTIRNEHPELLCTGVDLSPEHSKEEIGALVRELRSLSSSEDHVVLRDDRRFVSRLAEVSDRLDHRSSERPANRDEAFALVQPKPGLLDEMNLEVRPREAPGPGEVEIQVQASSLNFVDVLKALGTCPGYDPSVPPALGAECSGRVVAVGPGVDGLSVGDSVIALSPSLDRVSTLSRYLIVPVELVARRPDGLSEDEAASIPIAFLTAWYGLYKLANLTKGERVLIHAASGGVGLAAIQLAKRVGAEIFATAGSEEKREFVREQGVEHVFDSRDTSFFEEIRAITNDHGVDVVLNSLTGDALIRSIELLTPYGRFIEIGKRDIYDNSQLGMLSFRSNRLFAAVDLAPMTVDCPQVLASLLAEVLECFEAGDLKPLPLTTFPVGRAQDAFRFMAQARHIGKIAVRLDDAELQVRESAGQLKSDATYLVTGGLGALGLEVARSLVANGARYLVLWGRSAASSHAQSVVKDLTSAGAQVLLQAVDVSDRESVLSALNEVRNSLPALRGVVHAAGFLDDATLAKLTRESLVGVMKPKVSGAWNLHLATADDSLDFFVMFSSVASVLGLAGQGNYVAGNAFMDALAHHRTAFGLPATSINWGPWASVGLAAESANRGERLASTGLKSLLVAEGINAFQDCLAEAPVQRMVATLDTGMWVETRPANANLAFFGVFETGQADDTGTRGTEVRQRLASAEPGRERKGLLQRYICEQIGSVLRMPASNVHVDRPLKAQGLDSLMTLELRNRLDAGLGLRLPSTLTWNFPTVSALVPHLADQMGIPLDTTIEAVQDETVNLDGATEDVSRLTEDEAEALLVQKLASLESGI